MAHSFGISEYLGGCSGVIIGHSDGHKPTQEEIETAQREADEKFRSAWQNAVPLGGNPADVFGLNLALSVGDVSEQQPGTKRLQALEHLFSIYPPDVGHEAAQDIMRAVHKNLTAIQERAEAGEPIRVWYSNQPDDMCGLYWFMEQLRQWKALDGELFLVKLPEWELDGDNTIIHRSGLGELSPEDWHKYLDSQVFAPPVLKSSFAAHWRELQSENAPLRAVLNGQLVSAPESLYDGFIRREIEIEAEDEEFQEAVVIGRVLGKYRLGIGDAWVALRIEEMIRAGALEVLSAASKDSPVYHRMLRKRA
jgi:hypothetical protein